MIWIATAVALLGSYLNAREDRRCFYLWIAANLYWIWYDFGIGVYGRVLTGAVQTALCVYGIHQWR